MNTGSFKEFGTQTNDLELDGAERAPPGAGWPLGSVAPAVGPLILLFRVLVVSVLCRNFVGCIPPTLVSVPVKFLKTKYGTNKRNSAGLEYGEFKLYCFEIKGRLLHDAKMKHRN